jgi:hypothetical protein
MNRLLTLACALACLAAFGASTASAAPKLTNRMVTVKITGSMKTTWSAAPVPDPGCQNKPAGFHGSGTETVEWNQAKVLKGQLTGSGKYWGLMLFDNKNKPTSNMPISGSVQRQGSGSTVACGEDMGIETGPCVGKKAFDTNAQFAFGGNGTFTVQDNNITMTTDLYPDCNWVWNSMVVRTGAVLINYGMGKFDAKRLANGRSSVSLKSHREETCEGEDGSTPGVRCTTVTDWRVTLYPYKTKKGRR